MIPNDRTLVQHVARAYRAQQAYLATPREEKIIRESFKRIFLEEWDFLSEYGRKMGWTK